MHILSPAGLFLSAPYAESLFSLLSFLGHLLYVYGQPSTTKGKTPPRTILHDLALLASGLTFSLATTIRSNGILFGLLFAHDALVELCHLAEYYKDWLSAGDDWFLISLAFIPGIGFGFILPRLPSNYFVPRNLAEDWSVWGFWVCASVAWAVWGMTMIYHLQRLAPQIRGEPREFRDRKFVVTVLAGAAIIPGALYPQYLAYIEYCQDPALNSLRPWCNNFVPSITNFVQSHYWGNGLFKYWKLSNMPLFLCAAPELFFLLRSGWAALTSGPRTPTTSTSATPSEDSSLEVPSVWRPLALPQLALCILTITTLHIQIINRITSGYPLHLVYWAGCLVISQGEPKVESGMGASGVVRWIVMYALIQGALYAAFCPPA
jgi:Gpi18-like mannosyltransferase